MKGIPVLIRVDKAKEGNVKKQKTEPPHLFSDLFPQVSFTPVTLCFSAKTDFCAVGATAEFNVDFSEICCPDNIDPKEWHEVDTTRFDEAIERQSGDGSGMAEHYIDDIEDDGDKEGIYCYGTRNECAIIVYRNGNPSSLSFKNR